MLRIIIICVIIHSVQLKVPRYYGNEHDIFKKVPKTLKLKECQGDNALSGNENCNKKNGNQAAAANDINTLRSKISKLATSLFISTAKPSINNDDGFISKITSKDLDTSIVKVIRLLEILKSILNPTSRFQEFSPVKILIKKMLNRKKRDTNVTSAEDLTVIHTAKLNNNITEQRMDTRGIINENNNIVLNKTSTDTEKSIINNKENELQILLENNNIESNGHFGTNNRRFHKIEVPTHNQKLLAIFEERLKDIERKIYPLTEVKLALSANNDYRIGYIIANIDTLQIMLKKLNAEMKLNLYNWNNAKVTVLFERLKVTNVVVTKLLNILNSYLSVIP